MEINRESGRPRKRRRLNPDVILKRRKQKLENDEYYSSNYCSINSSWFLYQMAMKINKDDNSLLWCSILGLTYLLLNQQITTDKYNELINEFQELVLRKNNPLIENSEEMSANSSQPPSQ